MWCALGWTLALDSTDYYDVLGVDKTCTNEELEVAFHKEAQRWHPETSDSPESPEKFGEVARAYEVLSHPEHRDTYDKHGHEAVAELDFQDPFELLRASLAESTGMPLEVADAMLGIMQGMMMMEEEMMMMEEAQQLPQISADSSTNGFSLNNLFAQRRRGGLPPGFTMESHRISMDEKGRQVDHAEIMEVGEDGQMHTTSVQDTTLNSDGTETISLGLGQVHAVPAHHPLDLPGGVSDLELEIEIVK